MKKNYIILAVGIIVLVALDQITKQYIANNLDLGERIKVIEDFFYISSHRNDGGAWGILNGEMTIFYVISFFSLILFYYLGKDVDFSKKKFYSFAILLMIAGGIGNFIDRLLFKEVIDFLDFYIFNYNFPTFNVADICLVTGVILFAIDVLIEDVFSGKIISKLRK